MYAMPILFLGFIILMWIIFKPQKPKIIKTKCVKQPEKDCTYQIKFTSNGIHCTGHFGCCKIIDQMKAMNEAHCNAVPGKNYNGIIISKEFQDQCRKNKDIIMKKDSSGPQW